MKSFGDFASSKNIIFEVDDVQVTLEPLPVQLFERHIMGVDDTPHDGMVKYRVTFQYPRSQKDAKWGAYRPEVRYVLASSPQDARERIVDYVRNKKKKKITPLIQKPFPYLSELLRRDMNIRVKKVTTWKDLIDLLSYVVDQRPRNPLHYFDQHDLGILVAKLKKSRDFNQDLQNLPKKEQLLLKRIYLQVVNGPLSPENKEFLDSPHPKMDDFSRRQQLDVSTKGLGRHYPAPVYKNPNEEPQVNEYSTVRDIIREAEKYGITYAELSAEKKMIDMKMHGEDFDEKLAAWKEIDKRVQDANLKRQKAKNMWYTGSGRMYPKDFEDGDISQFDKFGGDAWATELAGSYPFLRGGMKLDPEDHTPIADDPLDDRYERMYDHWRNGRPRKSPSNQMWYQAFMELLEIKKEEYVMSHEGGREDREPTWSPDDDEFPDYEPVPQAGNDEEVPF